MERTMRKKALVKIAKNMKEFDLAVTTGEIKKKLDGDGDAVTIDVG